MSKQGDIGAPASHRGRFRPAWLLAPLALLAVWAAAAPFFHSRTAPAVAGVAAGR